MVERPKGKMRTLPKILCVVLAFLGIACGVKAGFEADTAIKSLLVILTFGFSLSTLFLVLIESLEGRSHDR